MKNLVLAAFAAFAFVAFTIPTADARPPGGNPKNFGNKPAYIAPKNAPDGSAKAKPAKAKIKKKAK